MVLGYDIGIKFIREVLSGCPLVVQQTCSPVMGGTARDSKQRNKRDIRMLNDKRKRLCRDIYSIRNKQRRSQRDYKIF